MDFIDLAERPSKSEIATNKPNQLYYPSLHISNKNLPIDASDVGKTITAMVKLKVNSVEKRATKGKKTESYSFDVLGINFNKKKMVDIKSASDFDLDQMEEEEFEMSKKHKKMKRQGGLYAA